MNREPEVAERRGPIRIRLTAGDALQHPADLAVIGSGPHLIRRIEVESGLQFSVHRFPDAITAKYGNPMGLMGGFRKIRSLEAPEFVWKNILSLKSRPSAEIRGRFQFEMIESVNMAVRHTIRPKKLLIVPYNSRPSEIVAMNLLWLIYCVMRLPFGKQKFFRPPEIEIVDLVDPGIFAAVVDDAEVFTAFVKHQVGGREWVKDEIRKSPPEFEFIRDDHQ
jgi:hypothetical protein